MTGAAVLAKSVTAAFPKIHRGLLLIVPVLAFIVWLWTSLPAITQFEEVAHKFSVTVRPNGPRFDVVEARHNLQVDVKNIPQHVINALLSMEDRRFYSHPGIDPWGIARALRNCFAKKCSGGSTLSQQLAKNMFFSSKRSFIRKLKEAMLAVKIERHYDKKKILEMYLNHVYFGYGTYGIETAARRYFRKHTHDLNVYEAALLIQSLPRPSKFNIISNERLAKQRANLVLKTMVALRYTTPQVSASAQNAPLQRGGEIWRPIRYQYLLAWITPKIHETLKPLQKVNGPITIITTLDPEIQLYADDAIQKRLAIERTRRVSEAALVAMEPDGGVRALVGGRDYGASQYNHAVQAVRQPGSAFKPMVYLAALEDGWHPNSRIADKRIRIGKWKPKNPDGKYLGWITLTQALAQSRNAATTALMERIGCDKVIAVAQRLGISSALPCTPALALGVGEVSVLELTRAYAVLANGGFKVLPYGFVGIRDSEGHILYWHEHAEKQRIVDKTHVDAMTQMLKAAVSPDGTGEEAVFSSTHRVAGKTGTTQEYKDAWFVGYTAHLVAGVWVGNDDNSPMANVHGGDVPAQIWQRFMANAHQHGHFQPQPLPGRALASAR